MKGKPDIRKQISEVLRKRPEREKQILIEKIVDLYNAGRGNASEQLKILYFLGARIATGLERKEKDWEKITKGGDQDDFQQALERKWMEVALYLDKLVKADPEGAFNLALFLATIEPRSPRDYRAWIRPDGPLLLAKDPLREKLRAYLKEKEGRVLLERLLAYMDYIREVPEEDILLDPNCFLCAATFYLAAKLKEDGDDTLAQETKFIEVAQEKLRDSQTWEKLQVYKRLKDTEFIPRTLEEAFGATS